MTTDVLTPSDIAQHQTNAAELRALALWADIQNAAQFLGRQAVSSSGDRTYVCPGISIVIGRNKERGLIEAFARVASAHVSGHLSREICDGPTWILSASVAIKGVSVTVQSDREPTAEEMEATR